MASQSINLARKSVPPSPRSKHEPLFYDSDQEDDSSIRSSTISSSPLPFVVDFPTPRQSSPSTSTGTIASSLVPLQQPSPSLRPHQILSSPASSSFRADSSSLSGLDPRMKRLFLKLVEEVIQQVADERVGLPHKEGSTIPSSLRTPSLPLLALSPPKRSLPTELHTVTPLPLSPQGSLLFSSPRPQRSLSPSPWSDALSSPLPARLSPRLRRKRIFQDLVEEGTEELADEWLEVEEQGSREIVGRRALVGGQSFQAAGALQLDLGRTLESSSKRQRITAGNDSTPLQSSPSFRQVTFDSAPYLSSSSPSSPSRRGLQLQTPVRGSVRLAQVRSVLDQ